MTKVGILTYHKTTNYGALLQAFALQSKLNELGADAEIINYHCKNIEKREMISFPKPGKNINIIKYAKRIKAFYNVSQKRKKMKHFMDKYMTFSKDEYTKETIKKSNKVYDKFVVGSDMVLDLEINGYDMSFYLDFAEPKKRYSYAASLGIEKIDNEHLNSCIEELEKFQHISIREEQGKNYFSKLLKNKVYSDIDPTLLYDGTFWKQYEEIPKKKPKKKYILLYFLNRNMPEFEIARRIAKENDMDIYVLSNSKKKIDGCNVIYDASVGEFLYYIHNAELVITASYHGLVFSINYKTNFMFFCHNNSASRLNNVARITGTIGRELKIDEIPPLKCDFSKIDTIIGKLRKKSIDYLKSIVEE